MLRRVALLACLACGGTTAAPTPVANTTSQTATAPTVSARCDRIAAEIAKVPGGADCCGYEGRRRIIGEHCTTHAWPPMVDVCGDPEPRDRLACPPASGLDAAQTEAWGVVFERLYGEPCQC